jgi:anaerobic magnesium-protoporphyrin IX monomethyl ester cyclase
MVDLLLIYPYFNDDNSIFKFPPLGIGYIASYIRSQGYSVAIIDCTFMNEKEVVAEARRLKPSITGIYSMLSMKESAVRLAKQLKPYTSLLVAGGPLPTSSPHLFLDNFDLVVLGEGEETLLDLFRTLDDGQLPSKIEGTIYREKESGNVKKSPCRINNKKNLDLLPFPSRDLYSHTEYKNYFRWHHGYTITSMITSRGCPFNCEFCSRPVFGNNYRGRSPSNIADEIESIVPYGYDRIWIADDIFPISQKVGAAVCDEIINRQIDVSWECLCRADIMNTKIASKMRKAGCHRVFFGLESGNNEVLKAMNKRLSVEQAKKAVRAAKSAGIKVGAFFILGYPGETSETVLNTIRFAASLSLDYVSFTVPYPIFGTPLYEKLEGRIVTEEWRKPQYDPVKHTLLYNSEFSMGKLKFAIIKAKIQCYLRKNLDFAYPLMGKPFEVVTDNIFKTMK